MLCYFMLRTLLVRETYICMYVHTCTLLLPCIRSCILKRKGIEIVIMIISYFEKMKTNASPIDLELLGVCSGQLIIN